MTSEEFKVIILPYYKNMYRVAASIMRSNDAAADAVQDAMLRLWHSRDKLKNVRDLESYCNNVARNVCINTIQRIKITSSADTIPDVMSDDDVHDRVEWRDYSTFVNRAINRLPEDQRYVLRLSTYGGLSNSEISELLGISQVNVRVMLSRARNRLKELLSK